MTRGPTDPLSSLFRCSRCGGIHAVWQGTEGRTADVVYCERWPCWWGYHRGPILLGVTLVLIVVIAMVTS